MLMPAGRACDLATDLKYEDSAEGDRSFPREADLASDRSDAGTSMLPRLIGIVKGNLSGAKRRLDGRDEGGGVGQGAVAPQTAFGGTGNDMSP
jgi:hypothetical protein